MSLYHAQNISYSYLGNPHRVEALGGVDFEVQQGDFMSIAGPSGSGKTTLLNILGLLEVPREGIFRFDGVDVSNLKERERTLIRRNRIGFIFQTYNLIPVLTAYENVEYPLLKAKLSAGERRCRVMEALETVGIKAQAAQRPNHMSNGQRQRVAIARALARDVEVVLADEPTAALDQATGLEVMEMMKRLNRERHVTFIFSSHDPEVLRAADRIMVLRDGKVTQ